MVRGIGSLFQSLVYRGRDGQWAWLLHRMAGLGVLLFLILHVLDIFLIGIEGGKYFEYLLFLYHGLLFRPLLIFLVFGLLFHAVNGLRIILIDFWPQLTRYQRIMFRIELAIVLAVMIPATWAMIAPFIFPTH